MYIYVYTQSRVDIIFNTESLAMTHEPQSYVKYRHQRVFTLFITLHEAFLDGYCSTVQGLLDWFEVDLGFTELLFIQIDLCVM